MMDREAHQEFEDEVRRISRALWPGAAWGGATTLNGRESDGLFISDDQINVVECTTSREKEKAAKDGANLKKAVEQYQRNYRTYAVKGWFVTQKEPTHDQRAEIDALRTPSVVALSFDQFRARLVDASSYLVARAHSHEHGARLARWAAL